jgi:hypothetical protein
MSKYEEQYDHNNSICPYCKNRYQVEGEDYSEDIHDIECSECGKKYYLYQSFSVTHHTTPCCELNKEQHQFERIVFKDGKEADFCMICDKCQLPKRGQS